MKYNWIFFVQLEFISKFYNKLIVQVKLIKGSNSYKTENMLLMVKRLCCVFDCETQCHLYRTFERHVNNINALDIKSPQGSFRRLLRRKSSFYFRR